MLIISQDRFLREIYCFLYCILSTFKPALTYHCLWTNLLLWRISTSPKGLENPENFYGWNFWRSNALEEMKCILRPGHNADRADLITPCICFQSGVPIALKNNSVREYQSHSCGRLYLLTETESSSRSSLNLRRSVGHRFASLPRASVHYLLQVSSPSMSSDLPRIFPSCEVCHFCHHWLTQIIEKSRESERVLLSCICSPWQ